MSILYVVATPIGNLEDITFRAVRVLNEVDLILCENTSNAQKLLKHYNIKTKTSVYFSKSKLSHIEKIFKLLEEGKSIAIISDAGTPGISDPGALLINEIRKRFGLNLPLKSEGKFAQQAVEIKKVSIVSIPGPTAITALFSIAGIFGNEFSFLGFVPQKKGRETFVKQIFERKEPVIFYESVHRIIKLLEQFEKTEKDLRERYGENNLNKEKNRIIKKIIIGRELTKRHEEIIFGSFSEVLNYFKQNSDHIRGEFVIMVV